MTFPKKIDSEKNSQGEKTKFWRTISNYYLSCNNGIIRRFKNSQDTGRGGGKGMEGLIVGGKDMSRLYIDGRIK